MGHPVAGSFAPLWFLADDAARQDRSLVDRIPAGGMVARSSLGPSRQAPFGAVALLRLEPDIGLSSWFRPATEADLHLVRASPSDGLVLLRPNTGTLAVRQGERQATATSRDAVLLSSALPAILRLEGVDRLDRLDVAAGNVSAAMAESAATLTVIDRDNAALALLGNYGAALMRGLLPVATGTLRDHAMQHMAGLVAIMCAEPASRPSGVQASLRSARMAAMKADIEARLDDPALTAKRFAEFHGVSLRSLQKLFEAEGLTFSQFVLERRLERAMRLLRRSAGEQRSISEIAFSVGFGDLSYFNRTFRRHFGLVPRQARADGPPRRPSN